MPSGASEASGHLPRRAGAPDAWSLTDQGAAFGAEASGLVRS
jgi:hypothetical protein